MAEIPVSSSINHTIDNNHSINDVEYAEPVNEDMTSSSSHADTSYHAGTSTKASLPSHYQELDTNNTSSHDYQTLQGTRTEAFNSSFIQSETSNPYQPLRAMKESEYQQLNRN